MAISPRLRAADAFTGRPVGRATELAGTWMRSTPGHWLGLEFTRDAQVIVSEDVGGPLGQLTSNFTFKYTVLDGGRVSFAAPNGQTIVFETRIAGDVIELTTPAEQIQFFGLGLSFGGAQQFRRLPTGKSLSQALKEEGERIAAEREKRLATVRKLLAGGNIVLAPPQGSAPLITLKFEPTPGAQLQGLAIVDDSPERPDFINPLRVHPFLATLGAEDIPFGESPHVTLALTLGPALEPLNQRHIDGRIALTSDGPADKPVLAGTADFPARRQNGLRLVLKSDAKLYAGVQSRLETQRETIRKRLATVGDALGGRVILTGTKPLQGTPQPQPVELTVERVAGSEAYVAKATVGRAQLSGVGALDMVIDRPVLRLAFQGGEEWRLQVKDDGKAFAGDWRPHQNTDFISHGNVALTVERRWTVEQLAAIAQAIERYVTSELRKPTDLAGRVTGIIPGSENRDVALPISLRLQTFPDGKVAGQAWFVAYDGGVELEGTAAPAGLFNLKATRLLEGSDKNFEKLLGAMQTWRLQLDIDPQPTLQGTLSITGPYGRNGPIEFKPASDAHVAAMREKIVAALGGGRDFVWTRYEKAKPAYFRLKTDRAGRITGEVVGEGDVAGSASPGIVTGEIVADRGHSLLQLVLQSTPELRGITWPETPIWLIAEFDGDQLAFSGWVLQTRLIAATGGRPIGGLKLNPLPAGTPAPVTDEERVRVAAQRLGAVPEQVMRREQLIKNPQPGDEALLLVRWADRGNYIQGGYTDGRYQFGFASFAAAAVHAGILRENELAVVRITFAPPFTESIPASEQNGMKVYAFTYNPRRPSTTSTFRIERVSID